MNLLRHTRVRATARLARRDEGQVIIMVVIAMLSMIGIAGLVIDVGQLDRERTQIQVAANAAGLAGADELANGASLTTAIDTAEGYSATVGDHNADGYSVTTTAQAVCLGPATMGTSTVDCASPYGYVAGSPCTASCNGIYVQEKTNATPWLMQALGFTSSSISASAMAADEGGQAQPVDAEVVLDTTASMADDDSSDPSDTCGPGGVSGIPGADLTEEDCAKAGIRTLLGVLLPCNQGLTTCGSDTNGDDVADPVDRVGLMAFPAMNDCISSDANGTCFDDAVAHDAGSVNPGPQANGDTGVPIETSCNKDVTGGAETDDSSNMTYAINSDYFGRYSNAQVVPFSSDYRTSDTATTLNGGVNGSPLVNAVDWLDCPGGTYPVSDGSGTTTSITGGNSTNTTTADDGGATISQVSSPATAVNAGINVDGSSTNEAGLVGGPSVSNDYATPSSTSSTSVTFSKPSGSESTGYAGTGLQIVTITAQDVASGDVICAPSGWTELTTDGLVTDGSGSTKISEETFYSTSAPSSLTFSIDTSTSCSTTGSATSATGLLMVYYGVNTSSPFDTIADATGSSTTVSPKAVTTTYADDRVLTLFGAYDGLSGSSTVLPLKTSSSNSDSGAYDAPQLTTGASTPPTGVTAGSSNWVAMTISIRPSLPSSITVSAPPGAGSGSFELVTVDARNLASGDSICAPSGWTAITTSPAQPQTESSDSLTQETFYSVSNPSSYTFSFETTTSGACSGTATSVYEATILATAYAGVNTSTPFELEEVGSTYYDGTVDSGAAGTSPAAATTTTTNLNDEIVTIYGTGGAFGSGSVEETGVGNDPTSIDVSQSTLSPITSNYAPGGSPTTSSNAWAELTLALVPLLSSTITVAQPSGWAIGDLVLVTVSVRGSSGTAICSPSGMTWTAVQVGTSGGNPVYTATSGSGTSAITQEAFWSNTLTSSDTSLTFSFDTSCSGGTAVLAGASAVALAYTGVDGADPISTGSGTAYTSGSGTALSAGAVTTTGSDDDVVGLYASDAATITGTSLESVNGSWTSTAAESTAEATAGTYTPAAATAGASGPWTSETITLDASTSIEIARPDPSSDPAAADDFILVTVTTSGLASGDTVCPPQDGTWTQVGSEITSGTLGQWSFYSFRSTADAEDYTFSFVSGSSCSGTTLIPTAASAIAVRYTGVAAAAPGPIDTGAGVTNDSTGSSGTTLTAPGLDPSYIGEDVVSLYSSSAASFSTVNPSGGSNTSGPAPATGFGAAVETEAGSNTSSETATASASDPWIGDTIALVATNGGCYGNCSYGVEDVGGDGTYYTGVINQAAASFSSNQRTSSTASVKDAIMLISDGDANATEATLDEPNGGPEIDGSNTTPWEDECQQAIAAAENAEAEGIEFYVLYYGTLSAYTPAQSTCDTDTDGDAVQGSYTVDVPGLSSLCAMRLMVDNPVTDPTTWGDSSTTINSTNLASTRVCSGTPATDAKENFYYVTTSGSLQAAFQQVGTSLTEARLVSAAADT